MTLAKLSRERNPLLERRGESEISSQSKPDAGFTLIELLVVVAIIAILASLLLSSMARAKAEGHKAACINNFRQLQIAWHLYIDDNNDVLPLNSYSAPLTGTIGEANWVGGALESLHGAKDWLDNTNILLLLNVEGGIGPYLNDAKLFKCPSDRSLAKIGSVLYPRVRSVTMNHHMGSPFIDGDDAWTYQTFCGVQAHMPRETGVVFIDTHEDSIATGLFLVARPYAPGWNNFPASRHNGGGTISFTDGHVIYHRWLDSRTRQPATGYPLYAIKQPGNPDIRWLQERATVVKPGGHIYSDQ